MSDADGLPKETIPLVRRFSAGGPLLEYAVAGLTSQEEQQPIGPGTWSVAQVVAHLLDSDLVFVNRMKQIIAEHEPTLQAFDENAWVERMPADGLPAPEGAALFGLHRRWTTRLLQRLGTDDFARVGLHTQKGRQTLAEVLAYAVNHLDHHLKFLYGKRARFGLAIEPKYTPEFKK
jgi:uncharacterized damage-inducible protein DinB